MIEHRIYCEKIPMQRLMFLIFFIYTIYIYNHIHVPLLLQQKSQGFSPQTQCSMIKHPFFLAKSHRLRRLEQLRSCAASALGSASTKGSRSPRRSMMFHSAVPLFQLESEGFHFEDWARCLSKNEDDKVGCYPVTP